MQRKKLIKDKRDIEYLKRTFQYNKDIFVENQGEDLYNKQIGFLDDTIEKLSEIIEKIPVGHRYEGTYYVRVPYTNPPESEKVTGTAFLREDLVSWERETGAGEFEGLKRDIYKDPEMLIPIKRDEGRPVYETS